MRKAETINIKPLLQNSRDRKWQVWVCTGLYVSLRSDVFDTNPKAIELQSFSGTIHDRTINERNQIISNGIRFIISYS